MRNPKARIYSFDVMRIVAVLSVVLIHAADGFLDPAVNGTAGFLAANFFDSISRLAVPIFLMISGALMLDEDKVITQKKMLRSAWNIFFLLVVWSVLYAIFDQGASHFLKDKPFSFNNLIRAIIQGHFHLWYLFVLISLYLITPVLRLFIKRDNVKMVGYYLLLVLIIYFCVPFVNYFVDRITGGENVVSSYVDQYQFCFGSQYLAFYILGWFLSNVEISQKRRNILYCCGLLGVVATVLFTKLFYDYPTKITNYFHTVAALPNFFYSVAVFVAIFYWFKDKDLSGHPILLKLSQLSFGVYIVHSAILSICLELTSFIDIIALRICLSFVSASILSFVATFCMSMIPGIKKLIRS